jgi:hypothetical protein
MSDDEEPNSLSVVSGFPSFEYGEALGEDVLHSLESWIRHATLLIL